jgi:hypothetical protein
LPEPAALEHKLSLLAADLAWPPNPDLAPAVGRRIRPRRVWFESRWAMAAAVAILALAAVLAYSPSRDAIAGWLNLHTIFRQVTQLPTPSPQPPGPLGQRLGLGGRTTLAQARSMAWPVLVPSSLGQPDEVYLQRPPDGPPQGEVTLVYSARPGISTSGQTGVAVLVTEARGAVNADFFGKVIGPGTTIETVTVAGHQGYWISGKPHLFFLVDAAGTIRDETLRLATNTLLIEYGSTIVRIEGDLTKAQALQIAESLA